MVRTAYAWTLGVTLTLFWSLLGLLTWPVSPGGELYLRFARIWSRMILGGLSIPLEVERETELDPDRPEARLHLPELIRALEAGS